VKRSLILPPLFLVPAKGVEPSKTSPSISFEDYGILNFNFDCVIDNQTKRFLNGQDTLKFEEIEVRINELNDNPNNFNFLPVSGYQVIGFENTSYIAKILGFNQVYADEAWDSAGEDVKIQKLLNAQLGKESNIDEEITLVPLDPSQERAMNFAIKPDNELTVIKGPPRTGKS
jgi:hypothetical protein